MESANPFEGIPELVLVLAVVLLAAKVGGEVVERVFKQPAVLGELIAGVVISPVALGGWEVGPIGPLVEAQEGILPVRSELFFVAQLAAVVLLFEAGLQTNKAQFFKYVRPASFVAFGGVVVPFMLGVFATTWFGFASFDSARELLPALFVGAAMTATSVGITARVLGDIKRINTPEGVTVLGAAVVDDVIGVMALSVIVGISDHGTISGGSVLLLIFKAVGFWLGLTLIGSLLSHHISRAVSAFRSAGAHVAVALALALLAAAAAEVSAGLAMIIGSYSLGLALSNTELRQRIEEPMRHINYFIVPLFFAVVGMQVDFTTFASSDTGSVVKVVLFTGVICALAIVGKVFGAGLPALAVGFNRHGATRIGLGMLPRGEVGLIVAGIGLGAGAVTQQIFGVVVVMTIVTTVLATLLIGPAFKRSESGLRSHDAPDGDSKRGRASR